VRTEAEFALALRQQRLLLRSEALRGTIALQAQVLEAPFATADQVRAIAAWVYAQRVWFAGAAVVVLVVRPRRAWRVARFAWWLWRSARRARGWLAVASLLAQRATDSRSTQGRPEHGQDHRVPAP
jgi:YqjK-like protein